MEPRLIGRGKPDSVAANFSFIPALQWSRDLLVAESTVFCVVVLGAGSASMEPRLIGRGKNG